MAEIELSIAEAVDKFQSVRRTRRQVLLAGGIFAVSSATGIGGMSSGFLGMHLGDNLENEYEYLNPPEDFSASEQIVGELEEAVIEAVASDDLDTARDIYRSDTFIEASLDIAEEDVYQDNKNEYMQSHGNALITYAPGLALGGMLGGFFATTTASAYWLFRKDKLKRVREEAKTRLNEFYPDADTKTYTEDEIAQFDKLTSYLPPVGGKIPRSEHNDHSSAFIGKLHPTFTAEQQGAHIISLRRQDNLGKEYIHQLTVQGRLPDRFKYAAIALILNSPYVTDWTEPFFEADWGKIAPLIHDGGNVENSHNPRWKRVKGRTDFLQRISVVYSSEYDEQTSDGDKLTAYLDAQVAMKENQLEEQRLLLESRFYQRAAFALHCALGTAPRSIPKSIREQAASAWQDFEQKMQLLLENSGIKGMADVRWFSDKPTSKHVLGGYGKRREAEWEPIQAELIKAEHIRNNFPEIGEHVWRLIAQTTERIDSIIGLQEMGHQHK